MNPTIVDLHSHYPMHLLPVGRRRSQGWLKWHVRKLILMLANRFFNYPGDGDEPAVTAQTLTKSDVRVALSMLLLPFDDIDLEQPYGAPPKNSYYVDLVDLIDVVEKDVRRWANAPDNLPITIAHDLGEMKAALATGKVALIHAVEGGVYLGDTPQDVRKNVAALSKRGVAYITLAHLFYRRIVTNAPAIPLLPDWLYRVCFVQPDIGLTELGREAVKSMVENKIIVDLAHMSAKAIEETLDLLDAHDKTTPVIAGHCACRFVRNVEYNIPDEIIRRIAMRNGVVGLIACKHWMSPTQARARDFEDSIRLIFRHAEHIRGVVGDHDHTAFGSDLDGFIKPSLPGLDRPAAFTDVHARLSHKFGAAAANKICSENALRVLGLGWR